VINKFIEQRCKGVLSAHQPLCTTLLDLSIANKLCELCLYSRVHNYIPDDLLQDGVQWALSSFDLTQEQSKESTVKSIKQILDFIIRNKTEEDEGTKTAISTCFKPNAKMSMLCQKLSMIVAVIGQSHRNSLVCLPALMDLQSTIDEQIKSLVQDRKILDMRGI
jgi:hypothetical protein